MARGSIRERRAGRCLHPSQTATDPGRHRRRTDIAGQGGRSARLGGAGAEQCDVLGRAALPHLQAVRSVEAEVGTDVVDDLLDRAVADVVVDVGAVQSFEQFGVQRLCRFAPRLAMDGVLDHADDALADRHALPGGRRRHGFVERAGERDGAPYGASDAVEADSGVRLRFRARRGGFGLRLGLLVSHAGEVGTHVDQLVQDPPVVLRVLSLLVGGGLQIGGGWLDRHERIENINFGECQDWW